MTVLSAERIHWLAVGSCAGFVALTLVSAASREHAEPAEFLSRLVTLQEAHNRKSHEAPSPFVLLVRGGLERDQDGPIPPIGPFESGEIRLQEDPSAAHLRSQVCDRIREHLPSSPRVLAIGSHDRVPVSGRSGYDSNAALAVDRARAVAEAGLACPGQREFLIVTGGPTSQHLSEATDRSVRLFDLSPAGPLTPIDIQTHEGSIVGKALSEGGR